MTSFSEWVRQTRRTNDLTLVEVADRAGVKQPVWSQWESGKAVPRRETVIKIADALGVPHKDALLRAGYLPSASEPEPDSMRLARQIEACLSQVRPDRRKDAERYLLNQAQAISEMLAVA